MPVADATAGPVVIDLTYVECEGCGRKQTIYHDAPLVGAPAILAWMRSPHMTFLACVCGHPTCSMAHRIKK